MRGLRRADSKILLPEEICREVEWIEGDILNPASIYEAMKGVEEVYHCAAIVSFQSSHRNQMMEVNGEGTAIVVNAALEAGVKKFLHVSSIAALGRSIHQNEITEETDWEESPLNSSYAISKYLGEMEVWRGIEEGLNAVIVNPSVILGAWNWNRGTARFFSQAEKGNIFYTHGTTGFVDVRDVAACMIQLMDKNISGQRFILNSENLTYKKFFGFLAEGFSNKPPSVLVRPWLSGIGWRIEALRCKISGSSPIVTRENHIIAHQHFRYDNKKISELLDYKFRSVRETIQESIQTKRNGAMMYAESKVQA